MAKNQSSYFSGKHHWSETKDELLACYLTPYFQKVIAASHDGIVYVDAFAGEGRFADGSKGSPLIALSKLQAIESRKGPKVAAQFILAEANQDSRLKLGDSFDDARGKSGYINEPIICPDFQSAVSAARSFKFRKGCRPSTFFFYIDPFGVKDLRMDLLGGSPNPNHTEVLLNFNSVGFIRDACAALEAILTVPNEIEVADEPLDYDLPAAERIERLTSCIGSDDWIDLIRSKKNGTADFWETEYQIARLFCKNASSSYKYVTNMPIKDMKRGAYGRGLIKYRMIHMTNHADGCVLMNNDMLKRNEEKQTKQTELFKVDVDGRDVAQQAVERAMRRTIESLTIDKTVRMAEIAASVISQCGVFTKSSNLLRRYLKPYIDSGIIERKEKLTKTGKPKNSFNPKDKVYRTR